MATFDMDAFDAEAHLLDLKARDMPFMSHWGELQLMRHAMGEELPISSCIESIGDVYSDEMIIQLDHEIIDVDALQNLIQFKIIRKGETYRFTGIGCRAEQDYGWGNDEPTVEYGVDLVFRKEGT